MKLISKKTVLETIPFAVEEMELSLNGTPLPRPYHRLVAPDWVNVLPMTSDHQAILIRQPRAGVLASVLECPGGMMDEGERDPTLTAARELEEETGFTSQRLLALASLYSNPAILTNRCHFFLALGCQPATVRKHFPDQDEQIKVELVPASELDHLVRTGQINHSLSALCVLLSSKYLTR